MVKDVPIFYSPKSDLHKPEFEYFNCQPRQNNDTPKRTASILNSLHESGYENVTATSNVGIEPRIARIHDPDYIKFLADTSASAEKMATRTGNPNEAIYPSIHPYTTRARALNAISRRGFYVFDTYTPIMSGTVEAALGSASTSIEGAKQILRGSPLVYSLNRPSGHHAETAMAGGMCYLNNSAIAAQYLLDGGAKKVAIFDIDLHHGNGTQDIFYERPEVLVANINADPAFRFPHFSGYADEHGEGEGAGANVNYPLPDGIGDEVYSETAAKALNVIKKFQPDYLIVSAGFDTHVSDPIGAFALTTPYYRELAKNIAKIGAPVLVVQEGGYNTQTLGENVVSFLNGLGDEISDR